MLLALMLTCCGHHDLLCDASERRLQTIKDQRAVILELNKIDMIGNKKFHIIDDILLREQQYEETKIKKRCKNEIE